MQSRLATTITRSSWLLFNKNLRRELASATPNRTADPAIHGQDYDPEPGVYSENPKGDHDVAQPKSAKDEDEHNVVDGQVNHVAHHGNKPLHGSSTSLESTGVNQPPNPNFQQKRECSSPTLEHVSCVGLDGSPWPKKDEDRRRDRKEEEQDDKEYFKHHKASPLSELQMAETRKPITQATDGTAGSSEYGVGRDVIGWMPEQLDTAEEALKRAMDIWKHNAIRGDPDSPHGRVLRELRGEYF